MYILIYTHTLFFVGHFSLLSTSQVVETTINLDQKVNIVIPYLSCNFLESFNQLYTLSKTSLSKDPTSALFSTKSTKKDTVQNNVNNLLFKTIHSFFTASCMLYWHSKRKKEKKKGFPLHWFSVFGTINRDLVIDTRIKVWKIRH